MYIHINMYKKCTICTCNKYFVNYVLYVFVKYVEKCKLESFALVRKRTSIIFTEGTN